MNELHFIAALRKQNWIGISPDSMGDDCASIDAMQTRFIVTTDMLMDKVHFDTDTTSLDLIARKAVNVNLSDLAAAGASPHSLMVSLAIPKIWRTETTLEFMKSLGTAAAAFSCEIIGGDTNVWDGPLVINVVAHGLPHWRGKVGRSGAKPGQLLFTTGFLGGSLQSGRHLTFQPRVHEARWLLDHFKIHAMMDISDGIASDARRLARESKVDIVLDPTQIPVNPSCLGSTEERLSHALCDGEDFELLFCIDQVDRDQVTASWPWSIPLRQIGIIVAGDGKLWLERKGRKEEFTKNGFVHGI